MDFLLRSLAVIVKVGGLSTGGTLLNREVVEGTEVNPGGNLMSVPETNKTKLRSQFRG